MVKEVIISLHSIVIGLNEINLFLAIIIDCTNIENFIEYPIYVLANNQTEITVSGYYIADANGYVRLLIYDNSSNDYSYNIKIEEIAGIPSYTTLDYSTFIPADGAPEQGSFTEQDNKINLLNNIVTGKGYSFTPQAGKIYKITCKFEAEQEISFNTGFYILKGGALQGNNNDVLKVAGDAYSGSELTIITYFTNEGDSDVRFLLADYSNNDLIYTITIEESDIPLYTDIEYSTLVPDNSPEQNSFTEQDNKLFLWSDAVTGKGYSFSTQAGKTYRIICKYEAEKEILFNTRLFLLKGGTLQGDDSDMLSSDGSLYYGSELTLMTYFKSEDDNSVRLLLFDYNLRDLQYTLTIKELPEIDRTHAFEMNSRLGMGINFGNTFEAPYLGAWGIEPDAAHFREAKEKGFSSLRLPVSWSTHAMTESPYTIDRDFMDTVRWAVNLALENELPIVLNIHHYNEMMSNPAAHKDRFLAFWDQISTEFQHYGDSLYFEIFNEPNDKFTPSLWNIYLEEALNKIREKNPERMVIIGTAAWGGMDALSQLVLPDEDPNIILTVHYYNPGSFTHQGEDWTPATGITWNGTPTQVNAMKDDMNIIKQYSDLHNVPVYIGEFGATDEADNASRLRWVGQVKSLVEEHGFSAAYWKFCTNWGVYDHTLECYYSDMLKTLTGFDGELFDCRTHFDTIIIKNSTFDTKILPWTVYYQLGGNGKVELVDGEARVEIITKGKDDWHVQFLYRPITLQKGYTYTLLFDAYASSETLISFCLQRDGGNYDIAYCMDDINLTTQKTSFSYTFTHTEETMNRALLTFNLGLAEAQYVYLDNIYLYEKEPTSTSEITSSLCIVNIGGKKFEVEGNAIEAITIYDVLGHICYRKTYPGVDYVEINEGMLPSNIGLVQVRTDVKSVVLKSQMRK